MASAAATPGVVCDGDVCTMAPADTAAADGGGITKLLGQTLLSGTSQTSTADLSGSGKYLGLYFSAHWCPPCKAFTPMLAKFYSEFKTSHAHKDDFDIVFVSSDKAKDQFEQYYSEMPWKALPYDQQDTKAKLSSRFKVSSIPTFVIVDAQTGALINADGRSIIQQDPTGALFPWKPPSLESYLEEEAVNAAGESKPFSEVATGKIRALYFSAHWCPPCRRFTPQLTEFYNSVRGTDKEFEVLFVSRDRSPDDHASYLGEMPWWAIPYTDTSAHQDLLKRFDVEGIPTLVLLDQDNKIIEPDGVDALRSDPTGADFPWGPKPVEVLSERHLPALNENVCCVYFVADNTSAGVGAAEDLLIGPATEEFMEEDPEMRFMIADPGSELGGRILEVLGKTEPKLPMLVMLQLPKYAVAESANDVAAFVALWKADEAPISSLE